MGKQDYYSLYMPFPYFYWILSSPFASRTLRGGRETTGITNSGEGERARLFSPPAGYALKLSQVGKTES